MSDPEWEFEGIFEPQGGTRPVMSRPPRKRASKKLRDMVQEAVSTYGNGRDGYDLADWVADLMERFGASAAHGSFDIGGDGRGPECSWCGGIWPLCGHAHMSQWIKDQQANEAEEEAEP